MKANRFSFLLLLFVSLAVGAGDRAGKVRFGVNLAKPASEHSDRLYLKIDDSEKLYFNGSHRGFTLAGLDESSDHVVRVFFDDKLVHSWSFNFSALGADCVTIWRSPGAWRMGHSCE